MQKYRTNEWREFVIAREDYTRGTACADATWARNGGHWGNNDSSNPTSAPFSKATATLQHPSISSESLSYEMCEALEEAAAASLRDY